MRCNTDTRTIRKSVDRELVWHWGEVDYEVVPDQPEPPFECYVNINPPGNCSIVHSAPEEAKAGASTHALRVAVHMREVREEDIAREKKLRAALEYIERVLKGEWRGRGGATYAAWLRAKGALQ